MTDEFKGMTIAPLSVDMYHTHVWCWDLYL